MNTKKLSEKQVRSLGRWLITQCEDVEHARELYVQLHNRYGGEAMYKAYKDHGYRSLSGFKKRLQYHSKST